ncbi:MAG TPA: bifunctional riboflavin kinase/FMN adenylyltransferase, partial [Flavitalea sp.]|nr:bifunctional riboflavin kinase/FMN adenylyltransferase [Flavitalea sp.]
MQVHKDIERLPPFSNAVITIGTFDGVHLGHQKILSQLKEEARRRDGETVIITFHPHPRVVVRREQDPPKLINTIAERIELLDRHGIDHLVIVPFTDTFSRLSAREYVEEFLRARFRPQCVIIGYDHRFGHDRLGDYLLLEEYGRMGSFELREIPQHVISHIAVSSTQIRKAIQDGNAAKANSLLGYDFFFTGTVVTGDQRGRTIGYPTANIRVGNPEKLLPGNGVYAVTASLNPANEQGSLQGMMSIGTR